MNISSLPFLLACLAFFTIAAELSTNSEDLVKHKTTLKIQLFFKGTLRRNREIAEHHMWRKLHVPSARDGRPSGLLTPSRVNVGGENQFTRMGHNFAARTGLDHFGDRMSSVHNEGTWLAG